MKRLACALLLAAALAAPAAAQSTTTSPFTLTVPLRIENVAYVDQARIYCIVSRLDAGVTGAASATNLVADGEVSVTITGGRYVGDVSVPTTLRGASATGARSYSCRLTLSGPGATPTSPRTSMTSPSAYATQTGHTTTRTVMGTEGPLTR